LKKKTSPAPKPQDVNLIRILSHQIKSPLNSAKTLLQTILEGFTGELNPQTKNFLERALHRADEVQHIIADIIEYESLSGHEAELKEQVDITALLHTIISAQNSSAGEKNISINGDLGAKQINILGNRRGLEIIFRNLIENAVKYSPPNTTVNVKIRVAPAHKRVHISVIDRGFGMSGEDVKKIFEPFYRSPERKAGISGTGLGLAIVKKITQSLGGTVEVKSEPAKGSQFDITLPYQSCVQQDTPHTAGKKIVIIGGVTSGPKAAARLRRLDENLDITIIEKSEFLSYSGCGLPAYISGTVYSPKALMSTADNTIRDVNFFKSIKNINVLNKTEALSLNRTQKYVLVKDIDSKEKRKIPYDTLILACGATAKIPPIKGIDHKKVFSLYNIEDANKIKEELRGKGALDIYIIGGGLIGIETAESLTTAGGRVTILEREETILPNLFDRDISEKICNALGSKGIKTITNFALTQITEKKSKLHLKSAQRTLIADFVILSTGVQPNSVLARAAGLEIGTFGGIKINETLQTSDKNIYAAGDCTESFNRITKKPEYLPLGSVSTKMGRMAADAIAGKKIQYKGFISSAMFRIFDVNIARTGLTHAQAAQHGFDPVSTVVSGLDRAHYYKNAAYIFIKLTADKKTRRILGAQGIGDGDVVSRIEILSSTVSQSMTIDEAFQLDLGYSPAFNSPINFVQTSCLVLANILDGLFRTITITDFDQKMRAGLSDIKIIDVSPLTDHTMHSIPGSISIPLENIRYEKLSIQIDDQIILYSKTSSGAYEAYRYLSSKGYRNMRVLEGGYEFWKR